MVSFKRCLYYIWCLNVFIYSSVWESTIIILYSQALPLCIPMPILLFLINQQSSALFILVWVKHPSNFKWQYHKTRVYIVQSKLNWKFINQIATRYIPYNCFVFPLFPFVCTFSDFEEDCTHVDLRLWMLELSVDIVKFTQWHYVCSR